MFIFESIWLTIAALVAVLYVFGPPLVVKSQFRKPAESGFRIVPPEEVSDDAREYLDEEFAELESLGFRFVCYLEFDLALDLMGGYGMVMAQPTNQDLVLVLATDSPLVVQYVEFSSEFADGTEINTNNSPQLPDTALFRDGKQLYWFPYYASDELYAAHTALCDGNSRAAKRTPPGEAGIVEEVAKGIREDFEFAVQHGTIRWDADDESFRLTLAGAYKLTWAQMFPLSTVGKMQKRTADRRALTKAVGR